MTVNWLETKPAALIYSSLHSRARARSRKKTDPHVVPCCVRKYSSFQQLRGLKRPAAHRSSQRTELLKHRLSLLPVLFLFLSFFWGGGGMEGSRLGFPQMWLSVLLVSLSPLSLVRPEEPWALLFSPPPAVFSPHGHLKKRSSLFFLHARVRESCVHARFWPQLLRVRMHPLPGSLFSFYL